MKARGKERERRKERKRYPTDYTSWRVLYLASTSREEGSSDCARVRRRGKIRRNKGGVGRKRERKREVRAGKGRERKEGWRVSGGDRKESDYFLKRL